MLEDFHFLDDHEMVIVWSHSQHHAMLHIEGNLARIPVLPARKHHHASVKSVCMLRQTQPCAQQQGT